MNTTTSLIHISGVGPKTAEVLAKAGLYTVGDILRYFPRRYEHFSHETAIAAITPGRITIRAHVESIESKSVRRGMTVTTATLSDGSASIQAVWFNQPYRIKQLQSGQDFIFSGEFEFKFNRYQLTNPSAEKASELAAQPEKQSTEIMPVYRLVAGLKTATLRSIVVNLAPSCAALPETLPKEIVESEKLLSYADAVKNMHFPESAEMLERARERLGFEELFQLLLASQLNKQEQTKLQGYAIPFTQKKIADFVASLPFALTGAQRRAAWDILQDFESSIPMNRLMQGDVGAGKTVVAGIAAVQAATAGYQTAFMAPTEILAQQHAATLQKLVGRHGITVGLLTGSVKGKVRKALLEAIEEGAVAIVVGTHALIQSTVSFHSLGFVVIDEQHRFGVAQRQALLDKSKIMPHMLAMTATPIPRSLALTVYGELDSSVLDEKPANRLPIITKIHSPNSRKSLYAAIDAQLQQGRQAYVICSLIDSNPDNDFASVQAEYDRLRNAIFTHRRIGLLHGKLSSAEKDAVMNDFAQGVIDILVSTTVVEVGVDVPNATIMIIEDADRFGLAQLHQLRGRVGRSELQSYCYLLPSNSKAPSKRLKELEKSNDGFYLAEVDLSLRGPGEIYGKSQHGALNLQVATLADAALIARAQRAARQFAQKPDNLLHYKELARSVEQYQRITTLN